MMDIDLKPLFERLDPETRHAFEGAAGLCTTRGSSEVNLEHVLIKLLEPEAGTLRMLLEGADIDADALLAALQHLVEREPRHSQAKPVFAALLVEWMQDAWLLSSLEFGSRRIGVAGLIGAIRARPSRYAQASCLRPLQGLDQAALRAVVPAESHGEEGVGAGAGTPADGALARFTQDFTARAEAGGIDPVFGRDEEVRRVVDILCRRRKNNPIAVGEPGVGKTALVEGLALRIAAGEVPDNLKNVRLLALDMGLLQAGASVKGEFENRLKQVIDEVAASARPIVLFIDEAHTIVGAGAAAGGSDAANLLKPALARGELRTIAATTWSEYKKYFEKDAALARRFQPVALEEPSPAQAESLLRQLRPYYEAAHDVYIRDDAVVAAAQLSARYLAGRKLPDKAIDVLDTACARVRISLASVPPAVADRQAEIAVLERELESAQRDRRAGLAIDTEREHATATALESARAAWSELDARWQAERAEVESLVALRAQGGDGHGGNDHDSDTAADNTGATQDDMVAARSALAELRGDEALVQFEVGVDEVAGVIADWTGIPLGRMQQNSAQTAQQLASRLGDRVTGQSGALALVEQRLQTATAGLQNPAAPRGVFLLVGPSGVGKTETALAVADHLYGGERFTCVINMSEFQEKHTVSRLIGSPPGYVGFGEGGILTEAVRQRPYSVVLLDEVEKAGSEVMNLFYQVFDKGQLADGEGRAVDFRNTVIFMTSNLASDLITELCNGDDQPALDTVAEAIRPILSDHFKPALLARMAVVPYLPIDRGALRAIVRQKLDRVAARVKDVHSVTLRYKEAVVDTIAARCRETDTGARNVDAIINTSLLPVLSNELLSRMRDDRMPSTAHVNVDHDGEFKYRFRR